MHLKTNILVNIYFLLLSSINKYNCLNINYIYNTKSCENASDYVYWYASTRRCNKTECKGYYEVGY